MLRSGILVFVIAAFCVGIASPAARAAEAGCEPGKIASKYPSLAGKTIKIGISTGDKPFTLRDPADPNKFTGFDVEYAKQAFACIGAPIEFSVASWPGLMPSLVAGQIDVMWDELFYTPERAQAVDFVLYSSAGDAIVVHKGNPKNIRALADLCGLRAVSQLGGTENGTLTKTSQECVDAKKSPIVISVSQDRPSGLRELDNDRVDAYLGIGTVSAYDPSIYEIAYSYSSGVKVGVGIRKGDTDMAKALDDSIKIMQADGSDKKLYDAAGLTSTLAIPAEILVK
jgi:polar amino acid transport system substrate-binding protein